MRKEIKKQLQMIMDQAVKDNQIAGMNMMVIKDGQEEAYLQCGYADKANGRMIERDTIFRLFSMTKPITAAAAMILFERGVIDLADPVSRYIPGFADQMVSVPGGLAPVWHNVTVYHLLSMTSGLTYGGNSSAAEFAVGNVIEEIHARLNTEHPMTTLEFADKIGRCPLEFQPGERWKYGVSADILAAVVEKASGMKYGEFLKKELFMPLGMKDTDGEFSVIGNYPYNISSQIFFKVLEYKDRIPVCSGMIQKEVAERIASKPGKKAYGILSVLLQAYYDIEYLFTVNENVFNPPPKVKSAVVRLTRNRRQHLDCDERLFKQVVKTSFNQRRKQMRNSLQQLVGKGNPILAEDIFTKRPEQLSVEEFMELTKMIETNGCCHPLTSNI